MHTYTCALLYMCSVTQLHMHNAITHTQHPIPLSPLTATTTTQPINKLLHLIIMHCYLQHCTLHLFTAIIYCTCISSFPFVIKYCHMQLPYCILMHLTMHIALDGLRGEGGRVIFVLFTAHSTVG